MIVAGLDLSLTSTGVAIVAHGSVRDTHRVRSTGKANASVKQTSLRLDKLEKQIGEVLAEWPDIDLAVIEAPSYGSSNGGAHERGHLWWAVARLLTKRGVEVGTVAPMTLKVYATGNGRAEKDEVLAAVVRRYSEAEVVGNDVADAVVLAAMGARRVGQPIDDNTGLTPKHLKAMDTARWPA